MYDDNKIITLNSLYAEKKNGSMNSNVVFPFGSILNPDERFIRASISVLNAQIPSSFYNINSTNNELALIYDKGLPITIILENGNYIASTLITELNTLFNGSIVASISKITGKITFTSTKIFTFINSPNTMMHILGLFGDEVFTDDPVVLGYEAKGGVMSFPFYLGGTSNVLSFLDKDLTQYIVTLPIQVYETMTEFLSKLSTALINSYPVQQFLKVETINGCIRFYSTNYFRILQGNLTDSMEFYSYIGLPNTLSSQIFTQNPIETQSLQQQVIIGTYQVIFPLTIPTSVMNIVFLEPTLYGTASIQIGGGTYSQSGLMIQLQTALNNVTHYNEVAPYLFVSIDNGYITIKSKSNYGVFYLENGTNHLATYLGFTLDDTVGIPYNYTNKSALYVYTHPSLINSTNLQIKASYPLNLLGVKAIHIKSSALAVSAYCSKTLGISDTLLTIPVNVAPYGLIKYEASSDLTEHILTEPSIEQIDIKLMDENDEYIDFNSIDWSMTLILSEVKAERFKSNESFKEVLKNINTLRELKQLKELTKDEEELSLLENG